MRAQQFELLEELGFTLYERKAFAALMVHGVADAESLCRRGEVPSSKIYQAMEKLGRLGLVEIQPTRPKLYSALPAEEVASRLIEISRQNADSFARQVEDLREQLASMSAKAQGRKAFVDLALGIESHIKRHVIHLAAAEKRVWSYLEHGDLNAIDKVTAEGFPILRRIARNTAKRKIDQRVVFGFAYQTAPVLLNFLQKHRANLEQVTGVRYSGELGHPFHIIDDEALILCLDHPFIPEGRFASLLVHDRELTEKISHGFQEMWSKAMRNLQEIDFQPPGKRVENSCIG